MTSKHAPEDSAINISTMLGSKVKAVARTTVSADDNERSFLKSTVKG